MPQLTAITRPDVVRALSCIIHDRFCCNRRSAVTTSLRARPSGPHRTARVPIKLSGLRMAAHTAPHRWFMPRGVSACRQDTRVGDAWQSVRASSPQPAVFSSAAATRSLQVSAIAMTAGLEPLSVSALCAGAIGAIQCCSSSWGLATIPWPSQRMAVGRSRLPADPAFAVFKRMCGLEIKIRHRRAHYCFFNIPFST